MNIEDAEIKAASTMYIPPNGPQTQDEEVIKQLGMVRIKSV
jgi:hypothetical protein